MCGRYALALAPAELHSRIRDYGLPLSCPARLDSATSGSENSYRDSNEHRPGVGARSHDNDISFKSSPELGDEGEGTRQSYNIAPGYIEPVYRAAVVPRASGNVGESSGSEMKYIVQGMKWGLIPSWTKHNPDYGSIMKTINCRDDSLLSNVGMWNSVKKTKRCVVLAEGFFEWQKKGKDKIPHFIKRKNGRLMYMAGLWDCVTLPDPKTGQKSKLYTYTIITVPACSQMQFLHDRMPALLITPDEIFTWLDPTTTTWTFKLQDLLQPFTGDLEIYPVTKEVGKVGNNDKSFILPRDSKENKSNIKHWFGKRAEDTVKSKPEDSESAPDNTERTPTRSVGGGFAGSSTGCSFPSPEPQALSDSTGPPAISGMSTMRKRNYTEALAPSSQETSSPKDQKSPKSPPPKRTSPTAKEENYISSITNQRRVTRRGQNESPKKSRAGDGNLRITKFFAK